MAGSKIASSTIDDSSIEVLSEFSKSQLDKINMGDNSKRGKGRPSGPITKTCGAKLDPQYVKFEGRKPMQQLKYLLTLLLTKENQTPDEDEIVSSTIENILEGGTNYLTLKNLEHLNAHNLSDAFFYENINFDIFTKYSRKNALVHLKKLVGEKRQLETCECFECKKIITVGKVMCNKCLMIYHAKCQNITLKAVAKKIWYCKKCEAE